jgi:hypothetical protein
LEHFTIGALIGFPQMGQSAIESLQYLRKSIARYAAKRESKAATKMTHVAHMPLPPGIVRVTIQIMKSKKPKVAETARKENMLLRSGVSMNPSEIKALAPMIKPIAI